MRFIIFGIVFLWSAVFPVIAQTPAAQQVPSVNSLLGLPDYHSPSLSPSGRYIAGIRVVEGRDILVISDLQAAEGDAPSRGKSW